MRKRDHVGPSVKQLHVRMTPELLRLVHLVAADLGQPLSLTAADLLTKGCHDHLRRAGLGDLITKEGKD